MKVSVEWLKDYIDIDASAVEIAGVLSDLGFPTEEMLEAGGDRVIDIEVTSNRGDCLSHIGVARELGAHYGVEVKLPDISYDQIEAEAGDFVKVEIESPELCPRYTGMYIEGVKVGASPEWLVRPLEAVGIRSVNNVVDATNYAMMETGQPSHAFDFDKVREGKIIVRRGRKGESLVSIDETKCELDEEMLMICDAGGPVAIAGVMGGLDSEISEGTSRVLLENARFDPVSVRRTGRKLGIGSEASYRFERMVDTHRVDWAARRTAQLIVTAAGGRIAKGMVDAYPGGVDAKKVGVRLGRIKHLLGIEVPEGEVMGILSGLGFDPAKEGDTVQCVVPSWRHDIYREADLIEEVARCYGYDKVPVERKIRIEVAPVEKREKLVNELRGYLAGCGYYETVNVTFTDEKTGAVFEGKDAKYLSVTDESRKSASLLRRGLLGSLGCVMRSNFNAGNRGCRFYEIADTFEPSGGELPEERIRIGLMCEGTLRELRGVVEGIAATARRDAAVTLEQCEISWADAGAKVIVDGEQVGLCGQVGEEAKKFFDLEEAEVCGAELDFEALLGMYGQIPQLMGLAKFPAISRDLSLILEEAVSWADICGVVEAAANERLEAVEFVDIYRGKPIPKGSKSLTLSLRFRDDDGTLTHEQVDQWEQAIVGSLRDKLGAELRK